MVEIVKPWGDYGVPGPNAECIELLEDALTLARSGECVAVALVMLNPSGFTKTRAVKGSRGYGELVGGIAIMQSDVIALWRGCSGG